MKVKSGSFEVKTLGFGDILDITDKVSKSVQGSNLSEGVATVFVSGSTAGISTIEYESGLVADLQKAIER